MNVIMPKVINSCWATLFNKHSTQPSRFEKKQHFFNKKTSESYRRFYYYHCNRLQLQNILYDKCMVILYMNVYLDELFGW